MSAPLVLAPHKPIRTVKADVTRNNHLFSSTRSLCVKIGNRTHDTWSSPRAVGLPGRHTRGTRRSGPATHPALDSVDAGYPGPPRHARGGRRRAGKVDGPILR